MTEDEENLPEPAGKSVLILIAVILLAAAAAIIALGKMGMIAAAPETTKSE